MLTALRDEEDLDSQSIGESQKELDVLLANGGDAVASGTTGTQTTDKVQQSEEKNTGWKISFSPHTNMLKTGNDTVRMLRELAELGEMELTANVENIPDFSELDPEESHMSWNIHLSGDVTEEQIREIFEWVDDECC